MASDYPNSVNARRRVRGQCTLEGCDKPHYGHGMCGMHYMRTVRYGDPLVLRQRSKGEALAWLRDAVAHRDRSECWPWDFCTKEWGYGVLTFEGKWMRATNVALILDGWPKPSGRIEVRHLCHNPPCTNPDHLRWGTHKENMEDMVGVGNSQRGTKSVFVKLSEADVREIRSLISQGVKQKDIASKFQVSRVTISNIKTRKSWAWLD